MKKVNDDEVFFNKQTINVLCSCDTATRFNRRNRLR